jgi:16S rRNA (adenine1518-N6/adenine1519-N6)-dimethyltransferase
LGEKEVVDLVDEKDRVIGRATLGRCLSEGLRHRAVAVLVSREGGGLLLQKRSKTDHWQPGRLTLSSTGHVGAGEGYDTAARRELSEELGLSSPVRFVKKLFLPKVRSRGEVEWEVVSLYASVTDAQVVADPKELDSVMEVTRKELAGLMSGKRLTPDAKILLRTYIASAEEGARLRRTETRHPQGLQHDEVP